MPFVSGWEPRFAEAARAMLARSAQPVYAPRAEAAVATKPAYSLAKYRRRALEQGQAGTCWEHSVAQLLNVYANANGYSDDGDADARSCRNWLGQKGKALEGGGSPANGGSPTSAITAAIRDGVPREDLWDYSASRSVINGTPPAAVVADAKARHLDAYVDVKQGGGLDAVPGLVEQKHPVAFAIWWPFGWDNRTWLMDSIGMGMYGHALTIIGHAKAGVLHAEPLFQVDNWHGADLYPALPADLAAKVEGYATTRGQSTSDFWVTRSKLASLIDGRYSELITGTSLSGYKHLFDPVDALTRPW